MAVNTFDTILSSAISTDKITYQWVDTYQQPTYNVSTVLNIEVSSNNLRYNIDVYYVEESEGVEIDKVLQVIGLPGKCSFNNEYFITIHEFIDGEDAWHYIPTYNVKRMDCTPIIK